MVDIGILTVGQARAISRAQPIVPDDTLLTVFNRLGQLGLIDGAGRLSEAGLNAQRELLAVDRPLGDI